MTIILRPTTLPQGIETLPDGSVRMVAEMAPGDQFPLGTYEILFDEAWRPGDFVLQGCWFKGLVTSFGEPERPE